MLRSLNVAIAIIRRGDRVLICRRKDEDTFGGYWEFPGGKFEPGETPQACICREIREELAVEIRTIHAIRVFCHNYSRVRVRLHPFVAEIVQGDPQTLECAELLWVLPAEIGQYRFPGANQHFVPMVIAALQRGAGGRGRRRRRRRRGRGSGEAPAGDPPLPGGVTMFPGRPQNPLPASPKGEEK